jgi:macrolide-specific efflux system membrane fusion protein
VRRLPSLLVNLALALLALGGAGWSAFVVHGGTITSKAASGQRTVTAEKGTVTATVTADGTLGAARSATASFATTGTVTSIAVAVGQRVSTGQILARTDPAPAQRALDLAEANLAAAEDALDRAREAGTDTTTAANNVTTAKLAATDARATLDGTRLAAPMTGTITAINGSIGSSSTVSGSSAGNEAAGFLAIADLSDLQVTADFAEADATRLRTGQEASITWSALTGVTATGKVLAIDPSATTTDGVVTYGVTVSIGTLPTGARPGQSVTVAVTTASAAGVVRVNSAAVTTSGSQHTVTVLAGNGTTETRTVRIGVEGDDAYEIVSGLTAGERVVVPAATTATSDSTRNQGPAGPGGGGPP